MSDRVKDAKTCGCGAAGFCIWTSILFSFRRRFLFGNGKAEGAELFAKLEIFAVCKGGESRFVKTELACGIEKLFIDADIHDIRDKHIVRAERNDIADLTIDRHRGFRDGRASEIFKIRVKIWSELTFLEFIDLFSRFHAAKIRGADKLLRCQIDDKFAAFLNDGIRMAGGTNGDISFWRMCAENARP